MVVRVAAIAPESYGKLPNERESWIFMEYSTFMEQIANHMSPSMDQDTRQQLAAVDPEDCATQVFVAPVLVALPSVGHVGAIPQCSRGMLKSIDSYIFLADVTCHPPIQLQAC